MKAIYLHLLISSLEIQSLKFEFRRLQMTKLHYPRVIRAYLDASINNSNCDVENTEMTNAAVSS